MNQRHHDNENDPFDWDNLPFEELLNRAQDGDPEAVARLIEKYRNYLLLIANQNVQNDLRSKMGASDAVQESMMLAHVNFEQFRGGSEPELKVWLKTILANDIRKAKRHFATNKRNSNREINMQDQSAVGRGLLDGQLTPSSEAIEKEKARAVSDILSKLSPLQQQVIQLRNFEKLNFAEIGRRVDKSEDAARKIWARSIETIKQQLKTDSHLLADDSSD